MDLLIEQAKAPGIWRSLATVKPKEIVGFDIEPVPDRDWNTDDQSALVQHNLFEQAGNSVPLEVVRKLPYRYYYRFLTEGDDNPRRMMIEDWEIGALYWNCLATAEGDEALANQKVREKYEDYFVRERDLYFFVGTTLRNHQRAPNPFVIVGVFWPPHCSQLSLF